MDAVQFFVIFGAIAAFAAIVLGGVHQDAGMPGLRHRDRRKEIRKARRPMLAVAILVGAAGLLDEMEAPLMVRVACVVAAACVFYAFPLAKKRAQSGAVSAARKRRTDPLS